MQCDSQTSLALTTGPCINIDNTVAFGGSVTRATRNDNKKTPWLTVLGLLLLAALTVVLVLMAMRSSKPEVEGAGDTPGYVETPQSAFVPAAEEEAEEEEPEEPQAQPYQVPGEGRVIAVWDDQVAYRSTGGPCPATPANMEVTRDGGATWEGVTVGEQFSGISRILARADGYVVAVTQLADDCNQTAVTQSYGFGDYWEVAEGGAGSTWFVHHENSQVLNAPDVGPVTAPCPIARLTSRSTGSALALCQDGSLASTEDSGATWVTTEPVIGAESVTVSGDTFLVAQSGLDGCAGTQVSRLDAALGATSSVCVASPVALGATAIGGGSDGAVWLWAADAVLRSFDGGLTWQ